MKQLFVRSAVAAMIGGASVLASADDGDFCTAPGATLLEDAAGDGGVGVVAGVAVPVDSLDLVSLQVAQPPQDDGVTRVVFTLKVASLATVPPGSAWFTSFKSPDGQLRGLRMITDTSGAVSFQNYVVAESATDNSTNGQLADSITPADPQSNYNADGTITLVAKLSDLHIRADGGDLKQFNAGTVQTVGDPQVGSASQDADGMPDDFSRGGSVSSPGNGPCGASKSLVEKFGGVLNAALLLPLIMMLGLRRRA